MTIDLLLRCVAILSRVAIAVLFLHEAWFKITHYTLTVAYMESFGVPPLLLPGAVAIELVGGIALALGYRARAAAVVLAGFSVMAALIFHLKWVDQNQLLHFEKDIAIAGGLLAFATGPLLSRRQEQQQSEAERRLPNAPAQRGSRARLHVLSHIPLQKSDNA